MLFSLSILFSCASNEVADSIDVNQEKIFVSYTMIYDADVHNMLQVTAQFRFGGSKGTTLILTPPSNVKVNGLKMNQKVNSRSGAFYEYSLPLSTKNLVFQFTDTEEKLYNNKFEINSIDLKSISSIKTNIEKMHIEWKGKKIGKNETVTVSIFDNEGNAAQISGSVRGSKYLVIKASDLSELEPGAGEILISRSFQRKLKSAPQEGGIFSYTYKSEPKAIQIIGENENEYE